MEDGPDDDAVKPHFTSTEHESPPGTLPSLNSTSPLPRFRSTRGFRFNKDLFRASFLFKDGFDRLIADPEGRVVHANHAVVRNNVTDLLRSW
jgi:hypothetical protein